MRKWVDKDTNLHLALWAIVGLFFVWSGIGCRDRLTWVMEVLPVVIGTIILWRMYPHFVFSRLVCWLLCFHAIVLVVGGHYTYAEVPVGYWVRDVFNLSRNPYDRLGHFFQGFVPAVIAREVFIRRGVVKRGAWSNFLAVCVSLAISATYELVEWQAAVWTGSAADAFLGTQGDIWDTQWDMGMALIGSLTALVFLKGIHDREMDRMIKK